MVYLEGSELINKAYSLYDMTGKLVLTGMLGSEFNVISIFDLEAGIYVIKVEGHAPQRLVKQ